MESLHGYEVNFCFCVALVSFCIPPLLHFVLMLRRKRSSASRSRNGVHEEERRSKNDDDQWINYWIDAFMLAWGLTATCITSTATLHKMAEST